MVTTEVNWANLPVSVSLGMVRSSVVTTRSIKDF